MNVKGDFIKACDVCAISRCLFFSCWGDELLALNVAAVLGYLSRGEPLAVFFVAVGAVFQEKTDTFAMPEKGGFVQGRGNSVIGRIGIGSCIKQELHTLSIALLCGDVQGG